VVAAHNSALAARSAEVEPAHLVLGLLAEPTAIAAKALTAAGVSLADVEAAATAALPPGADDAPDLVPYSDAARVALAQTLTEALRLGHNYVGTEHLLLALLAQEESAPGVLTSLGVDRQATEQQVTALLAGLQPGPRRVGSQ
jgi:ATP-dependent Clp protease ATP-binding subunit ClpA